MGETRTPPGTLVGHPDNLSVKITTPLPVGEALTRLWRLKAAGAEVVVPNELEAIFVAVDHQYLEVADVFEIAPSIGADRRRQARVDVSHPIEIAVSLAADEQVILLVESKGVFAWQLPEARFGLAARWQRDGGGVIARFMLRLVGSEAPTGTTARGRRGGRVIGAVVEPIRVAVLKFAAGRLVLVEQFHEDSVFIEDLDPTRGRAAEAEEPVPAAAEPGKPVPVTAAAEAEEAVPAAAKPGKPVPVTAAAEAEEPVPATAEPAAAGPIVHSELKKPRRRRRRIEWEYAPTVAEPEGAEATAVAKATDESREAPPVECHLHAEMAEQPAIERLAGLLVTLSRAALDKPKGPTSVQGAGVFRSRQMVVVQVLPRRNCRVVGNDRLTVELPGEEERKELFFEIQGVAPGEAEVWVIARQDAQRIVTVVLQPIFVAYEGRISAVGIGSTAEPEGSLVELLIYEDEDLRPRLLFVLRSDDLGLNESGYSDRLQNDTKAAYINGLYRRLETYIGRGPLDYDDFIDELREMGCFMYEELVPEPIRRKLWEVRDRIGSIRVISQEPAIPWELAHIKEPGRPLPSGGVAFFAEKGLVRWLHNLRLPPVSLLYAGSTCRYLVPDYDQQRDRLPGAAAERGLIKELFDGASEVEPSTRAVRRLLGTSGSFDILHIACHGVAEGASIWDARLILQSPTSGSVGDCLAMPTVRASADLWESRPIVFLNACQVGRRGRAITGTGGLAEAFLRQGAGLVIGSLWSIADEEALTFAHTFYRALKDGRTLIQATTTARAAAAKMHEPTWLAYAVYGHPYAHLLARQGDDGVASRKTR